MNNKWILTLNSRGCSLPTRVYGFLILKKKSWIFWGFSGFFEIFMVYDDFINKKKI